MRQRGVTRWRITAGRQSLPAIDAWDGTGSITAGGTANLSKPKSTGGTTPFSSALLTGGDRISLGSRCRIGFRRLNAASASASLHISGARLPWGGVQAVLLMDRELIIGPLASAHVRTRDSTEQLVLQAGGDGTLLGRASERIALDGRPGDRITPIALGARVTVGNLSLVVTTA